MLNWTVTIGVRQAPPSNEIGAMEAYEVVRQYECNGCIGFNVPIARAGKHYHAEDIAKHQAEIEGVPYNPPQFTTQAVDNRGAYQQKRNPMPPDAGAFQYVGIGPVVTKAG